MNKTRYILIISSLFGLIGGLQAQEPFGIKPTNIPKTEVPEGLTAEQYIKQVFKKRHYPIKVTFKVIDENSEPLPGVDIDVGIDSLLHVDGFNNYKGKTDAKGLFTVQSRGRGCSEVVVRKDGYYESRPDVKWDGKLNPGGAEMHKNGGFRPWNPTVVVMLKKIGKPIPMIVRLSGGGANSWLNPTAEQLGKEMRWDLVVGDWLPPHGTGKTPDLILIFHSDYKDLSNRSAKVSIKMGNSNDGFLPLHELKGESSLLKFPREAPKQGYELLELNLVVKIANEVMIEEGGDKPPKGYLLRIRTRKDEESKVVSAMYGKITGPFQLNPPNERYLLPQMKFDYYLNPTPNDRNLEYDQKNNLAPDAPKGLSWPP